MSKIKAAIIGGSGYAGGELLRLLLFHPQVKVVQVTSQRFTGQPVGLVHPNLRQVTDLIFSRLEELETVDVIFSALPNGKSMEFMPDLIKKADKVIDLGADFRLDSADDWRLWYATSHQQPGLLKRFVYGLPEINRATIKQADLVACGGCSASVAILTLYPALQAGLIKPDEVVIDAKMSSSQAGNKVSLASHHPERAGVVRSYKPAGHRHTAEVQAQLSRLVNRPVKVALSATSLDMVRGILVTIHTKLVQPISLADVWRAYRRVYQDEPFIRLVRQSRGIYRYPEPKILSGTNWCDIGFELDEANNRLVLIGAIDNLMKGTAGSAVQCFNLMFGFDERLGLSFPGLHPI